MHVKTFIDFHLSFIQMGFLAACPYMLKSVLGPLGGISADFLIKYEIMTIRNVRALYYAIGKYIHSS